MSEAETNPTPTETETPPTETPVVPTVDPGQLLREELALERKARVDAEARLKAKDEEALKKSKNWEELAKIKEAEAQTMAQKYEMLQNTIVQNEKLTALKTECLKIGINPQALHDLDLMVDNLSISVEATSTGKILVHGAESAAQLLKAKRPFWFTAKPASVNPVSPSVSPLADQPLTIENLTKLELEMKKNPTRENQEKYKAAILQFKLKKA